MAKASLTFEALSTAHYAPMAGLADGAGSAWPLETHALESLWPKFRITWSQQMG
jgi:hypothetical protein